MSRPQSESEYLARMVPPSVAATGALGRRTLLKGAGAAGAAVGLSGLLAACGSSSGSSTTGSSSKASGKASGSVTLGSNQSDPVPKGAVAAMVAAFTAANAGIKVKSNVVDHNTFQENINNYLQGRPDDVFTWFAGYRMKFFASKGLIGDISDVWGNLPGFNAAFKTASTADDGKQYFVPWTYYPWAIFYRKSVFAARGYTVPKTLDELTALSTQMKKDGLNPIAFADKAGWPEMGTFDVLNMRVNGFQYHVDLMAGKEAWDSPKTKKVFDTWRSILPYHQSDSLGRTWQEAAQSVQQKKSGMYLLGLFVGQQFAANEQADLDFFTFPEVDSTIGADAIDAPIDGFMMGKKPKNEAAAKKLLAFLASAPAGNAQTKADASSISANSGTDTAGYTALQKKAVEFVGQAKSIGQFLDRDTRPDFASTVVIPALQDFIKKPTDIDGLTKSMESQKKSIFSS